MTVVRHTGGDVPAQPQAEGVVVVDDRLQGGAQRRLGRPDGGLHEGGLVEPPDRAAPLAEPVDDGQRQDLAGAVVGLLPAAGAARGPADRASAAATAARPAGVGASKTCRARMGSPAARACDTSAMATMLSPPRRKKSSSAPTASGASPSTPATRPRSVSTAAVSPPAGPSGAACPPRPHQPRVARPLARDAGPHRGR